MLEAAVCVALAKQLVFSKIEYVSQAYGVSEGLVDYIVRNESSYNNCAEGDYHVPRPSVGLVQINLHYHPNVSVREATDPDFALRFLAEKLSEGKCDLWTTCRKFRSIYPGAVL